MDHCFPSLAAESDAFTASIQEVCVKAIKGDPLHT